jgi:Domain of unknown function (DUF4342)
MPVVSHREEAADMTQEAAVAEASTEGTARQGPIHRIRLSGEALLNSLKDLMREGNVARIVVRDANDGVLLDVPLAVGVVGTALLPVWAAVGAVVALGTNCSIEVERRG